MNGQGLARRLVTDELWSVVEPLIAAPKSRRQGGGRPRAGDRAVFTAITFTLTSGCSWRGLPPIFGVTASTAHRRYLEWTAQGLWDQVDEAVHRRFGTGSECAWTTALRTAASARSLDGQRGEVRRGAARSDGARSDGARSDGARSTVGRRPEPVSELRAGDGTRAERIGRRRVSVRSAGPGQVRLTDPTADIEGVLPLMDTRESPVTRALDLGNLPRFARRDALEELVVATIRRFVGATDDDMVATDVPYADLGLTSMRLTQIRQHLETALDLAIDAATLFNRPTIDELVDYLDAEVELTGGLTGGAA